MTSQPTRLENGGGSMSWRSIVFPDVVGDNYRQLTLLENNKIYGVRHVERGGNYVLYEADIITGIVVPKDTGIPVPSTDGHYNIRFLLPTTDKTGLVGCYARWTGLICYEFNIVTGVGKYLGTVCPGDECGLNYTHLLKIREDTYFMIARTANNRNSIFKFKGAPEQILDSTLWEKLGDVVNDTGVTPYFCADIDSSINFTYPYMYADLNGYLVIAVSTRCPANNIGKFALAFFDVLREKLYNTQFQPVDFGLTSYNSPLTIIPTGIPWNLYVHHAPIPSHAIDYRNGRMALAGAARDSNNIDREFMYIVDMTTRTAEFKRCPGGLDRCAPILFTEEGKIIVLYQDSADNMFKLGVYNPATESVENILYTLTTNESFRYPPTCLATEDTFTTIPGMAAIIREVIVPPDDMLNKFMVKPKRVTVTSEGPGSVRVQAEFHKAPVQVKIQLYNVMDGTMNDLETLPGATSIDRTYTVPAGRYRVRVVGTV